MRIRTLLATTALLCAWAGLASAEKWDMPLAYPETNFHTENAKAFAACVKEGTKGAIEIVTHANGSLFKGSEIKRAVQTGQAPIGERLLSAHENENALFGFDAVPFLATSYEQSDKLEKAARPYLEKLLDKQNLVLLYTVPWPPQGIYTKKPLNSGADMKGVKFRSYNAATARMAELLGAQPVQIEAAELAQALATGVVESFISSGSTGYDIKVWEHLRYWYDTQAWLPRNSVFVNKAAWNALKPEQQQVFRKCAEEAQARGTAKSKELANWYIEQLRARGMVVEPASAQLAADLKRVGEVMTQDWLARAGEEGKAIVEAYRKL
ncbi:MAG: TRAP transporter substrate-binding protein [Geminicoccaceae bacterium]|nr:TRAP transporter substrate-binding protein [Geminicoccaceae bacterium]MCS7267413.1 TRAP transporter substrate-binding protein [Geminicoccaceae bacterium]MCX7629487.1 TRAP transporter substrate-binding protein [Geminicoccaceae bacterium]MDW8125652.1 TRAP transporter substrate-binding protein [Geminicoccaceae bacterium]MDW8339976.1 TRAP transporter substrate-binding protein [Geminicoccaceae bacterium]